jgi:hypothetical protein
MSKSIHEAINAVMGEVGYVKKTRSDKLSYSFAGEAALISALRPAMVEQGIYMHVLEIRGITRQEYSTKSGTSMVNTVIQAVVRFTHAPSGTSIDTAAVGEGSDAGDKGANKAMTGLYKYALRQTFCIETGDDPDKFASEERAVPKEYRQKLIERYDALSKEARKFGVEVYDLNEHMQDEEITEAGVELKSRLDAAKAGK